MISLQARRPLNRWDHDSVRPGPVGSVGDVHLTPRLKTSMHGEPIRWGPNAHEQECRLGANISDGEVPAYGDGGRVAALHDSNWGWRDSFRTERGWRHEDVRAPDRTTIEMMGGLPQYSWHNTLATTHHARVSGDAFLPLPGGYGPGPDDLTRGGLAPRTTDRIGPPAIPLAFDAERPLDAAGLAALAPNYGHYSGVSTAAGAGARTLAPTNLAQAYQPRNAAVGAGGGGLGAGLGRNLMGAGGGGI